MDLRLQEMLQADSAMNPFPAFPSFDEHLNDLNQFILELVDTYQAGKINSWGALDDCVKEFFTPERMEQMELVVPGWRKMASYSDGITLAHVMGVFLGVFMLAEFQALTPEQQQLAKWIVLFHDLDKFHIRGKKDSMHAFNSAALTAKGLASFGFPTTEEYPESIGSWSDYTVQAFIPHEDGTAPKPDNRKLPQILNGLNQLYGINTPATLITKTVLFHISLDVDPDYPTPAPLTEDEIKRFIDPSLVPLLRVMMLGDNEGWAMFEPEAREHLNDQTRAAFQKLERLVAEKSTNQEKAQVNKEFWAEVAKNDYKIPTGYTLGELTKTLFSYLGSTDPELRDDIAYIVYANWLKRELYSKDEISTHVAELLGNLDQGIGETESDSVFLRSFSVLLLAEVVHNDNKKPLLEKDQITSILARGLWYLDAEKDPRGYIPVKGWAHALAHTADLMLVLGGNLQIEKTDLENILREIAKKLVHATNWTYIHGEDDRLANAVTTIFHRNLLTMDEIRAWLESLTKPGTPWVNAWMEEGRTRAFGNVRNFLRSLLLNILSSDTLPGRDELQVLMMQTATTFVPY